MDVCFDLLIPGESLSKLATFREQLVSWAGENLGQDPPRFSWRNSVVFTKRPMPDHIAGRLPPEFSLSGMEFLSLDGDGVRQWEEWVNSSAPEADAKIALREFLSEVLSELDRYAVVFEIDCDRIDDVVRVNPQQVVERIDSELLWTKDARGFIGWLQ